MNSNHGLSSFPSGPGGEIAFAQKLNKGFENKNCSERKGILLRNRPCLLRPKRIQENAPLTPYAPFPQS